MQLLKKLHFLASFAERGSQRDVGWNLFMKLPRRLINGTYYADTTFAFFTFLAAPASFYLDLIALAPKAIL